MTRLLSTFTGLLLLSRLFAQPGTLDHTFNGTGFISTPIGSGDDVAQSVVVQSDGKIILAGYADNGSNDDFALLRYNTNGTPDNTFSGDGKVTTTFFSGDERIAASVLQPDGKILVAGYTDASTDIDFAVARYLPNGNLDNTFSGDGKLSTQIGGFFDKAYAIALQPDGKMLVAGNLGKNTESDFAVVRYKDNGDRDSSFGLNGIATVNFGPSYDEVRSMLLQPNGSIVLAGFSNSAANYDFALARLKSDGSPDNSFGNGGKVLTPVGSSLDYAHSAVLQPDGKILVAGYTSVSNTKYDFALLRYLSDGTLDHTFNGSGIVTTAVGTSYDVGRAMVLQADGKIIVGGYSYQNLAFDFALVQYRTDGLVDSTFGNNGIVVGAGSDEALALALAPDGKIVAAGRSDTGNNLDFAAARYFSSQVSGLTYLANPLSGLSLAPNPVGKSGVFEYDLADDATLSLSLYDLSGKRVQTFFQTLQREKGHHQEPLDFDKALSRGVYLLVLQNGSNVFRQLKVIK